MNSTTRRRNQPEQRPSQKWTGPYEKIIKRGEGENALCYYPQIFVNQFGTPYTHAYAIGDLIMPIWGENRFRIFERATKKALAVEENFTTDPARCMEGLEYIASLTNWHLLATRPEEEKAIFEEKKRVFALLDEAYPTYFGCEFDFSIFGKRFMRAMTAAAAASKARVYDV